MGGRSHRPPCKFFRQGTCRNGDNCRFKHVPRSSATTSSHDGQSPLNASTSPTEQRDDDADDEVNSGQETSAGANNSDDNGNLRDCGSPTPAAASNKEDSVSPETDLSLSAERTTGVNGGQETSVGDNINDGSGSLTPAATITQDDTVPLETDLSLPVERLTGGDAAVGEEEEEEEEEDQDITMIEGDASETESEVEFDFEFDEEQDSDHELSVATTAITPTQNPIMDEEQFSPSREPVASEHGNQSRENQNENANNGSADSVEQNPEQQVEVALPPAPSSGSRYAYTEVELPADDELLRAVVARAAQFMDPTQRRLPVWHSIAALCGDRFPKGGEAAQARVVWLQKVCKDPLHHQHALLTPEMKQMIQHYEDARASNPDRARNAKKRKRVESTEGSARERHPRRRLSSTSVNAQTVEEAEEEKEQEEQDEQEEPTAGSSVVFDVGRDGTVYLNPELEEEFMALLLQYADALAQSERKEKLWDAIALASNGRFKMGSSARHRLMWLLKIHKTPTHREHGKLTPTLREMLTTFLSFNPFARVLKSRGSKAAPLVRDKSSQLPVTTSTRPATASVAKAAVTTPTTVAAAADGTAAKKRRVVNDAWLTIQPEMDELLMKLVVEKRPFDGDRYSKPVIWAEITQALQNPRIHDGVSGLGRVRWLVNVYANHTHSEHARLTPMLRELLSKYVDLYAAAQALRVANKKQPDETDTTRSETAAQSGRGKRGDAATDASATSATTASTARTAAADNTPPGATRVSLTCEEDALLREVLRVRPFHHEDQQRASLWDQVADNLAQRLGSRTAFPSGAFCKTQMRRLFREMLLATSTRRSSSSRVVLTESQLKMNDLLDRLVQTNAVNLNRSQTDEHRLLVAEIDAFLSKLPSQTQTSDERALVRCSVAPAEAQQEQEHERGPEQEREQEQERDRVREPEQEHEHEQELEQNKEREHESEGDDEDDTRRMNKRRKKSHRHEKHDKHKRKHTSTTITTSATGESTSDKQLEAIQAEVRQLRTLCASSALERAQFTNQIASLQEEVATCRTQLALQATTLDQERREHREELRAMVDVLVRERESHHHTTAATLDVIQKDREDRREEFAAMMKLVTRSATSSDS